MLSSFNIVFFVVILGVSVGLLISMGVFKCMLVLLVFEIVVDS